MKLLIVSQYFWPENFIITAIVRKLMDQGHEVTVATGKPNYPDGEVFAGYRAWGTQHERFESRIDVFRVPLWPRGRGGAGNLILNYLSFVFSGLVFFPWLLRKREFDAILVFAPSPISQVIPAIFLKWLKKAHLAVWVQDLWPESLAATGFVKHPHLLKGMGHLVRCIYAGCDTLLVQSQAFIDPVARYARLDKIIYYPNSMDAQPPLSPQPLPQALAREMERHFCVVFAGNLGTAQALDTLVQAAAALRDEPRIRLILVGSGSRLGWLQAQKQANLLDNLVLPGRFPMEAMSQIFERASVLLVSLKDEEIFAQTVPSKIQAYLAAGRPIIASLRGEGARVIDEAGAGYSCEPEQAQALAGCIRRMASLPPEELAAMGGSGRAYFDKHFDMARQIDYLIALLKERASVGEKK